MKINFTYGFEQFTYEIFLHVEVLQGKVCTGKYFPEVLVQFRPVRKPKGKNFHLFCKLFCKVSSFCLLACLLLPVISWGFFASIHLVVCSTSLLESLNYVVSSLL